MSKPTYAVLVRLIDANGGYSVSSLSQRTMEGLRRYSGGAAPALVHNVDPAQSKRQNGQGHAELR